MPTQQKTNRNDEKLDQVIELLGELKSTLLLHTTELVRLSKCAQENKEAIKGNGKNGLETRMAIQEESTKRANIVGTFLLLAILGDVMSRILLH
jgi:uncharacterized protein HemY